MATQGPLFPGTVNTTSVLPEDDNDWLNPGNVAADDGAEATITAATYDAGDISFRLRASNFGFTTAGTIDGITVEIEKDIAAGAARDNRVQLATGPTSPVGDNKATATAWPSSPTIATYGGVADTWAAGLTSAQVNSTDFAVFLAVEATAANTDIGVDFIRVTVTYTPPAAISGSGGIDIDAPAAGATGKESMTGSGGVTITAPLATATGKEAFTGSGGVDIDAPAIAASGTHTESGVSGSAAVAIAAPAVAGSGTETIAGSGGLTLAAPAVGATGAEAITGTAAVEVDAPAVAGTGLHVENVTGTAAVTITVPAVSATGSGGVAEAPSPPRGAAIVIGPAQPYTTRPRPIRGSGSITIRAPSIRGTGGVNDDDLTILTLEAA